MMVVSRLPPSQRGLMTVLNRCQVDKETVKLGLSAPSVGASLTIIGFGLKDEGGDNSNTLLKGQVTYIDTDDCASIFEDLNEVQPDIMLCAEGSGVDA